MQSIPFPFLASQRSRATLAPPLAAPAFAPTIHRHPASIHRAPSCATSPRSSSIPPRARPCPTSAEVKPQTPSAIAVLVKLRPELRPPVDDPLPAFLRAKRTPGELPRGLILLPDLFPNRIRGGRRRIIAALPRTRRPPSAHAATPPLRLPVRHHRAPRGRLASVKLAPPAPSAALCCAGQNGRAPPRAAARPRPAHAPAPPRTHPSRLARVPRLCRPPWPRPCRWPTAAGGGRCHAPPRAARMRRRPWLWAVRRKTEEWGAGWVPGKWGQLSAPSLLCFSFNYFGW